MLDYVYFIGYIMDKPHYERSLTEVTVYEMAVIGDIAWIPCSAEKDQDQDDD